MAVVLAGCGYVGPILPPALDIPQHVSDLRAGEYGDKVVVEFTIPGMTTEGLPLKDVRSVELAAGVAKNPFSMNVWASEAKKFTVPATAPGALNYEFPIADWIGKDVTMAVRATGPKGKTSDWSNLVTLPVRAAIPKPADLKAEDTRDGIGLTWKAPGGEHFRIYRASGTEQPALLDSTDETKFVDTTAETGSQYRYYVEAHEGEKQHSDMAVSAPVTREDAFPPLVPAGLTAEMGSNTIELSWERNTEPRFRGYNVYRSVDGGPFAKIASMITAPSFSDRDVQAGKKYRYQVSAVGVNGMESARTEPYEITAQ
jgi:hypothetical protein